MLKSIKHDFSSLIYMAKHFYEYGKFYCVIQFLIVLIINPITTILSIFRQKSIIDAILIGDSWVSVVVLITLFQCAFFLMTIIDQVFSVYSTPIYERIIERLDKMVFKKAVQIDLKNFNKPDFFDNYSWTIDNFSNQSNSAKNLLIDFFTNIVSIIAIITVILVLDHFLLIFVIIHIAISFIIKRFRIENGFKMNLELLGLTRVFQYVKRILYDPQNAIELKINRSSDFLFKKYDIATEKRKEV